ncbi:hypothetical protein LWI29_032260 [Acer saccharum]|uniref:Uncharacterized protein n=1 Tax=Acer saccharum TaxID=4024 RepID=A0AA39W7F9_ACESA|nr:hypothetical protein LWI29_032260 [Acer saccharum]
MRGALALFLWKKNQGAQSKTRGAHVYLASSSSDGVSDFGRKGSFFQRSNSDSSQRKDVSIEKRVDRKGRDGLNNLSHIEGPRMNSSDGICCQGIKENGKKVWQRKLKSKPTRTQNLNSKIILEKDGRGSLYRGSSSESSSASSDSEGGFWGRGGHGFLKGDCSKVGHSGSQVRDGPIQKEQDNGPVHNNPHNQQEGQLWVNIGPNQKPSAAKVTVLEDSSLEVL